MSKQSYIKGFRKKAEENGLDARGLARYALAKQAEGGSGGSSGIWGGVMDFLDRAKGKWDYETGPATKSLLGALALAGVGTGLGAAVSPKGKRKKGMAAGAILGALAGATVPHVNWKAVKDSFRSPLDVAWEKQNDHLKGLDKYIDSRKEPEVSFEQYHNPETVIA